jgi:ribosome-associated translation inhibitor RaiA
MRIDIQARGFTLTPALGAAVRRAARHAADRTGDDALSLRVRLFDVNGVRGGVDKGCIVAARIGRLRRTTITTSFSDDLYRAIASAFEKLERRLLASTHRVHTLRRRELMQRTAPELS